jgi:hypothetical protein
MDKMPTFVALRLSEDISIEDFDMESGICRYSANCKQARGTETGEQMSCGADPRFPIITKDPVTQNLECRLTNAYP